METTVLQTEPESNTDTTDVNIPHQFGIVDLLALTTFIAIFCALLVQILIRTDKSLAPIFLIAVYRLFDSHLHRCPMQAFDVEKIWQSYRTRILWGDPMALLATRYSHAWIVRNHDDTTTDHTIFRILVLSRSRGSNSHVYHVS
jgi:hypothetical protein